MATTTEQLIRDLREQIEDLSKRAQPSRQRSTFAERFRADLAGATEASPGYQAVHAMIQREVGGDLARHVSQHGCDLRAYVAVMKAYYSREGRQARAA